MKIQVLCVDDDLSIAHLLADIVTFCKYEPIICLNVFDALKHLRNNSVKAVLADYLMPKLTGIDLLEIIQERRPDIRRVLITAAYNDSAVKQAINDGLAQLLIPKPFNLPDVRLALAWL